MEKYGLSLKYFTSLRFLGEIQSLVYTVLFLVTFFLLGGFWPFIYATLAAITLTVVLQRFVINTRQPYPESTAIIITGCSSGIGFYSAIEFAKKGAVVYATVRKQTDADRLLAELPSSVKGSIVPVLMDVNSKEDIKNAYNIIAKDVKAKNLGVLSLINNAGYGYSAMIEQASEKATLANFQTNLFGVIDMTNTFLPLLRSQKHLITKRSHGKLSPTIMIVSSIAGTMVMPAFGIYSATKFATESIADAYRAELIKQGINCVMIKPGQVRTNFFEREDMNGKHESKTDALIMDDADQLYTNAVDKYYHIATNKINQLLHQLLQTSGSEAVVVYDRFEEAMLTPKPLPMYIAGYDAQLGYSSYATGFDEFADLPCKDLFYPLDKFTDRVSTATTPAAAGTAPSAPSAADVALTATTTTEDSEKKND